MISIFEQFPNSRSPYRNIYIYLALLIPVTIFAFWKTYFGIFETLQDTATPLVHAHALLMFLWLLMLMSQAWFIRTKRFRAHHWLGRSSFVIAPLIILSGLATLHAFFNKILQDAAIHEIFRLHVLAFGMVLAFGITWGLAIVYRRQPAVHMRFMISTAFAIATAIVWRIFYFWVPGCDIEEVATAGNYCVLSLFLLILIAVDWRKGVKRSAYWVVTIVLNVMHVGYWTFAKTDGWFIFCQWYANFPK